MYSCQSTMGVTTPAAPPITNGGIRTGHPVSAFSLPGMGLFDGGIDFTQWGLTEWLIVGGGLFLALGGTKFLSGKSSGTSARRKSLQLAKARYELARAQA